MKIYTAHIRRHGLDPERDFVLVPEGFTLLGFLLTGLWTIYHRLWLATIVIVAIHGVIAWTLVNLGGNPATGLIADLAIALLVGLFGNDIRRRKLERQGFVEEGVVSGQDLRDAERRFLDDHPALAADMADGVA